MHELFKRVLNERDLSRAGDLFSIPDYEVVNDLSDVVSSILQPQTGFIFMNNCLECGLS